MWSFSTLTFIFSSLILYRLETQISLCFYWFRNIVEYNLADFSKLKKKKKGGNKKEKNTSSIGIIPHSLSEKGLKEQLMYGRLNTILRVALSFLLAVLIGGSFSLPLGRLVKERYDFTIGVVLIELFICLFSLWNLAISSTSTDFRMCIAGGVGFAFSCFFFISMVPPLFLPFDLHDAYDSVSEELSRKFIHLTAELEGFDSELFSLSKTTFFIIFSVFIGILSGVCVVPSIQWARCHHRRFQKHTADSIPFIIVFVLPCIAILSYINPLFHDLFYSFIEDLTPHSEFAMESLRFSFVLLTVLCRTVLVRPHIEAFLRTACDEWDALQGLPNPTPELRSLTLQRIFFISRSVCVLGVELIAPSTIAFCCSVAALLLKGSLVFQFVQLDPIVGLFGANFLYSIFSFISWWVLFVTTLISSVSALGESSRTKKASAKIGQAKKL